MLLVRKERDTTCWLEEWVGRLHGCTAGYVAVVERAALVDGTTTQGAGAALSRRSNYLLRAAKEGAIR